MPAGSHPQGRARASVAPRSGAVFTSTPNGAGVPPAAAGKPATKATNTAKKQRRPDPWWAKVLIIAGALLMMLSGTAIAGGTLILDRYTGSINQQSLLGGAEATSSGKSIDGPLNILMVGTDERPDGSNDGNGARSDSIIILHITANHQGAYLVSIPRDTRVQIPAFPKSKYAGGPDKINSAFFFGSQNGAGRSGGFELLALTIKRMTGISFDAAAIVNFSGFKSVVKALDGVDMCVDEKTISIHVGFDSKGRYALPFRMTPDLQPIPVPGVKPQVYMPGCQHLTDWQALDYVRQRELIPDGDYGRQRHQQQFVKAVAKKTVSAGVLTNPQKMDAVMRAAGKTLTVDPGRAALTDWLFTLKDINPGNMMMIKTNGGNFHPEIINGQSFETLDPTSKLLFQAIRDDTVEQFVAQNPTWISSDAAQPAPPS